MPYIHFSPGEKLCCNCRRYRPYIAKPQYGHDVRVVVGISAYGACEVHRRDVNATRKACARFNLGKALKEA